MLSQPEKTFLERLANRAKTQQRLALRAKILLTLDQGHSVSAVARDLKMVRNTVKKWRDRWREAQDRLTKAQQDDQAVFEALALGGNPSSVHGFGRAARARLDAGSDDARFLAAKIKTARFYAENLLPQAAAEAVVVMTGAESTLALADEDF